MHVRGRSSRQQPWWLFVIALSYVLILTFSSAAPTGRALQQSNPELSAVKNVHPEVYQNLAKARLGKRGNPEEYKRVDYPGERFTITKQNERYMFHFLYSDSSGVMQTLKWSQLPFVTKTKYRFLEHPVSDQLLQQHGITLAEHIADLRHTYENPMMPAQKIRVLKHDDGKLEFDYQFGDGIRRVPANELPVRVQNFLENIPEIGDLLRNAPSSSRLFHLRK